MLIQKHKAAALQIKFKCEFNGFNGQNGYLICTDMQRLQQVLLNFQSNALKFTPPRGSVTIICTLVQDYIEYSEIRVSVKDNGCGIKPEDQLKLFKQFGFLDATREINTNGIGLGLHISKCLVEQFEGKVSVDSKLLYGSTFTFTFRLSEAQAAHSYVKRTRNPNMVTKDLVFNDFEHCEFSDASEIDQEFLGSSLVDQQPVKMIKQKKILIVDDEPFNL